MFIKPYKPISYKTLTQIWFYPFYYLPLYYKSDVMVHKVIYKSSSGSTKYVDKIYFEVSEPNTYASYVLLKKHYFDNDETNVKSFAGKMRKIQFSRSFLKGKLKKDGKLTCCYCKKSNLRIEFNGMKVPHNMMATIDHIIPISKGGGVFDESNVCVCCSKCNSKKGDMGVEEFLKYVKPYLVVSK